MRNIGYFFSESIRIMSIRKKSVFISLSVLFLIFVIALFASAFAMISSDMLSEVRSKAEISVYYENGEKESLIELLNKTRGVEEVRFVSSEESNREMADLLGEDADILSFFEENPFEEYLEVRVNPEYARENSITEIIRGYKGVTKIQENKQALEQIITFDYWVRVITYTVIGVIAITTALVVSFVVRESVMSSKKTIQTLSMMGAPKYFIRMPFILSTQIILLLSSVLSFVCFYLIISTIMPSLATFGLVLRSIIPTLYVVLAFHIIGLFVSVITGR